jgi:hypothetical protein
VVAGIVNRIDKTTSGVDCKRKSLSVRDPLTKGIPVPAQRSSTNIVFVVRVHKHIVDMLALRGYELALTVVC